MKFNIYIIQPQGNIDSLAFLELAELLNYALRSWITNQLFNLIKSIPVLTLSSLGFICLILNLRVNSPKIQGEFNHEVQL
jgi:hypothetical protein